MVDGRTLSSADYSFSIAGANAHLLLITNVTAQNTPNAAANNVIVSLKYTEFDGSILGGATSIPTPFRTVTATAGPTFATQQPIAVVAATSITGFTDPPGTVRISNINLSTVVKIIFQYDAVDTVAEIATLSTPTAVAAGRVRSPTGIETAPTTNNFLFNAALMSMDDINTIDTTVTPGMTINGLVAALPATGNLNTRVNTIATNAAVGLGLSSFSLASSFAKLLVPIRDGERLTVTYLDDNTGAGGSVTIGKQATIDLSPPTISLDQPVDKSFAGAQSTLQVTINDAGAGLRLADVSGNLRTNPLVFGNVVTSSVLASAPQYSLSLTPTAASPIREGITRIWVGNTQANGIIRDELGNEPRGSGAVLGADTFNGTRGTSGNPFQFSVDKAAPTLTRAITGGRLDTDPTSGTANQIISDSTARNAITVELDLGIGGAPVDEALVSLTDFQVTADGVAFPVAGVIVGSVPDSAPNN